MFCDQRVLHFAALCFHLALLLRRILSNLVSDNIPAEIVARLFVKVGRSSCPNLGRHVGNVCDRKLEIISITTHSRLVLSLFDWFSCCWWYPSTLSTNLSRLKILDLRFGWFCVLRILLKIWNLTWLEDGWYQYLMVVILLGCIGTLCKDLKTTRFLAPPAGIWPVNSGCSPLLLHQRAPDGNFSMGIRRMTKKFRETLQDMNDFLPWTWGLV